ncbi:MAG: GNAT family N-acetyltransferase [bacterium]|nr:GNAT family N-acetyltransferase [bacterium]
MIKIAEIKNGDTEKAYQFCMGIFEELGWDKRFSYGLKNLKDFFNNPKEAFFLAKEGKRIIGCGGLKELSKDNGLMKRFYVAKDFRGKGVACLIFKKIRGFAEKQGYKVIILDTFKNNFRAQKFYQKQGFRSFKPKPNENWKESLCPELFEFLKLKLK